MTNKLKVINLISGPGSGKSTIAAGLFYKLKLEKRKVELVTEFAKEKVYEGTFGVLEDQIYVFAKQQRRLNRLIGQVDLAISDSPLLLSIIYNKTPNSNFNGMILDVFNNFDNINFYIDRHKPYFQYGRTQNEDEARKIDDKIKQMLHGNKVEYYSLPGDENSVDRIISQLKGII